MAVEKQKPGVGVGLLIQDGNKILLARRAGDHGAGSWSPIGGFLDFGESFEDCGRREAREEIGVELVGLQFRGVTNDLFEDGRKHSVTIWFEAHIESGEPRIKSPGELDRIEWFEWVALPEPLYLPLRLRLDNKIYAELR